MKSVLQNNKECFVCKSCYLLEDHHIFFGTANRKKSEKYGMKVWLCHMHHTGNPGVHFNKTLDMRLKTMAQTHFEEHIGTRELFIQEFGKSWL